MLGSVGKRRRSKKKGTCLPVPLRTEKMVLKREVKRREALPNESAGVQHFYTASVKVSVLLRQQLIEFVYAVETHRSP